MTVHTVSRGYQPVTDEARGDSIIFSTQLASASRKQRQIRNRNCNLWLQQLQVNRSRNRQ